MNNRGKLFIHIGPPKTATTSLQIFFQELEDPNLIYCGIFQPREEKEYNIGEELYRSLVEKNIDRQKEIIIEIDKILSSGKSVSISEEMFLVESRELSWESKIEKLYQLTKSLSPKILIILREPLSAIKSYYQEMYYRINKDKFSSFNDFIESDYCTIYRYDILIKKIRTIGFKNLLLLDFKKLISGKYRIIDIFGVENLNSIMLEENNKSKKTSGKYYAKNATLRKLLNDSIPAKVKKIIKLISGDDFARFLPKINLSRGRLLDLSIKDQIKEKYQDSYYRVLKRENII